jgi:F0F1-type ATP synthase epsilon subunit
MPRNSKSSSLSVTVSSRQKTLFAGSALSVSSKNKVGDFDILPEHANFVTLVFDYVLVNKNQENERKIELEHGVLTVLNNAVKVYIGL